MAIERAEGLLVEHLHTLEVEIFCVSPKISARARERYRMAAAKSDAFDAFVLADTLRHEHRHWRPLIPPSPLLAELRAISRDRDRLIIAQQACENRLRAVLEAYHPAPLHLFSTLDRDITLDFLTDYPTPEQAARVGTARMDGFCRRHGYSGRTDPAVLVERLRPHLLSAGAGTTAGKAFSAGLFTEQLRMLNTHLRAYNKRLDELLDAHPDTPIFTSFPGIGPVVAATLISEMGEDRARFPRRRRATGRGRPVPGHPRLRAHPPGPVPLRRQPPHAPRDRLVGVLRRPRGRLVPPGLRRRPRPRPGQVPRPTRPGRPLDPHPLALLDRPHPLRPGHPPPRTRPRA